MTEALKPIKAPCILPYYLSPKNVAAIHPPPEIVWAPTVNLDDLAAL
jgi:hypothetical protein